MARQTITVSHSEYRRYRRLQNLCWIPIIGIVLAFCGAGFLPIIYQKYSISALLFWIPLGMILATRATNYNAALNKKYTVDMGSNEEEYF